MGKSHEKSTMALTSMSFVNAVFLTVNQTVSVFKSMIVVNSFWSSYAGACLNNWSDMALEIANGFSVPMSAILLKI